MTQTQTNEPVECRLMPDELPVEDKYYKPDLEISDRFQAYSAELLRVSLVGIAIVGFFYEKLHQFLEFQQGILGSITVKRILILSLIFLATSAAFALVHRYLSSDSMSYHLNFIRLARAAESESDTARKNCLIDKAGKERKRRNFLFRTCEYLLGASAFALAVGAFCLVIGFAHGLK